MRSRHRRHRPPTLDPVPLTPRGAALDLLREKISTGQAGLDPYDPAVFILDARDTERVWARRALELCGLILDHTTSGRFRAILEDDVRMALGLDTAGRALMGDEPLASRAADALMEHTFRALAPARVIQLAEDVAQDRSLTLQEAADRLGDTHRRDIQAAEHATAEPVSLAALREAKNAYDRRTR